MSETETVWLVTISSRNGRPYEFSLCDSEASAKSYALDRLAAGWDPTDEKPTWSASGARYATLERTYPVVEIREIVPEWCECVAAE